MTAEEAAIFESGPLFEECKTMRRWDEAAKEISWHVPPLSAYVPRILAVITEHKCDAAKASELAARTSFVREGNVIKGIRSSRL